jgi:membrane protease YdiL (CAAX protease family)
VTEAPPPGSALSPEQLSERVAAVGLLLPVALMLLLSAVSHKDGSVGPIALSDTVLAQGIAVELVLALTMGYWLWRRGWRPLRTATYPFQPLDLARGMILWAGAIVAVAAWVLVCRAVFPHLFAVAKGTEIVGAPRLSLSLAYSVFNAVFEELLWLGLGFAAFRRFGMGVAGVISVALRLLAHGYQGPLAQVTVLPVGIVFTLYYVRTSRLWPIVVAHAFQDTLALSLLAGHSSSGLPNIS